MEREANYLAVGTFVLLVLVMGVLFIYWYSSTYRRGNFHSYEIYFDSSVSGLTVGSPVRYLGVDVGQVQSIHIDSRSAERVQVVAAIDANTPISSNTVAQLSLQGITGLLYVDLRQHAPAAGAALIVPAQHYPVIASEHSNLQSLLNNLPQLATQLQQILERVSRLFSDDTIDSLGRIANHLDAASAELPRSLQGVDALVAQLRTTVRQANQILADFHGASGPTSAALVATMQRLQAASDNLARVTGRVDRLVADNSPQLSGLLRDAVPQLESLLRDSRAAVQQINALARSLHDDPSRLLYQPARAGVTIPP